MMDAPLWSEAGFSRYPWEREALDYVRHGLSNHEPFRAWPNVEFIADDGTVNDVDLLVVVPNGVFLIEIKSYPEGTLSGDGQQWRWRRPDGGLSTFEHPLIATDRKAKRLKSLLARQRSLRNADRRIPFIEALVFLSGADLSVQLDGPAKARVVVRDDVPSSRSLPGILATLRDPAVAGLRMTAINRPMSKALAEAVVQAGITPTTAHQRLGDWTLGELLDEGPGWQDWAASRTNPRSERRVRIYLAGRATSRADEERLKATARQEFRLLEHLRHPHISAVRDLQQHEHGPALLIERESAEERLDHWIPGNLDSLDLIDRVALVRQIGEALAYAHRQGIAHRMLTPRHVLVRPTPDARPGTSRLPHLVVGHWNVGTAELATTLTTLATKGADLSLTSIGQEMAERMGEQDRVYLAPELTNAERPDPIRADLFSLGAIAALIFSGRPPAADLEAREAAFATHLGFVLSDSLPTGITQAITFATDPNPADRHASIDEFLHELEAAIDDATSPDGEVDPLDAAPGDVLEGGWACIQRLGSGATAVALLCRRGDDVQVLKVASSEEHAKRLRDEAEVLERLWSMRPDPVGIVGYRGIGRVSGHTTLFLTPAGVIDRIEDMTLGSRLRRKGRPALDILARWGDDLLETLSFLERAGVGHRDIKPDNLGVAERGKSREPHLVLFDFSLAMTPATDLGAGTPGYLDPFLPERQQRRWDTAADRYSAAVTLFEMATGSRPLWGDGGADPRHTTDELPNVEPSMFDPTVADGLSAFFERGLHRDPQRRFGTAEDMRAAWRLALSAASAPTHHPEPSQPLGWDPSLPIQHVGLSAPALGLLESLGVHTVGQLVDQNGPSVSRKGTVSNPVRLEILAAAAAQRRLRDAHEEESGGPADVRSIDAFVAKLLPSPAGPLRAEHAPLARVLGLEPLEPVASADTAPIRPPSTWPGPADAHAIGLPSAAAVRDLLDRAKSRWTNKLKMKPLRDDLKALLERSEGIASGEELARGLAVRRGTTATGAERLRRARPVVRAALETASAEDGLRWIRIANGGIIATLVTREDLATTSLSPDDLAQAKADYAGELGRCADEIADSDPLLSPPRALAMLRAISRPAGMAELSDSRLLRLAADASSGAALSSRNELYPKGMAAERALLLARAALHVPGTLSEEQIRERVDARFPEAEPLPPMAALTPLLREHGLDWDEGAQGFRVSPATTLSQSTMYGGHVTAVRTLVTTDEAEQTRTAVQHKLDESIRAGGYLVCSVDPSRFLLAERALEGLGAVRVDVDAAFLDALHEVARERNITWDAILAADAAGPGGPRWGSLNGVAKLAVERIEAAVLSGGPLVLLSRCGLLERYDRIDVLDRLREATTRAPLPGQSLRTVWVLVPNTGLSSAPMIGARAVPTLPGSSQRLTLDAAWFTPVPRHDHTPA